MRFSSRSFRRFLTRKRKSRKSQSRKQKTRSKKQRIQRTRRYRNKQRGGNIMEYSKIPKNALVTNSMKSDAFSNDLAGFEEELKVTQE